jgi:hypothetical protein
MSIIIKTFFILAIIQSLLSCSNDGYKVENNKVVYEMPWNEGHGTVIKRLNADPNTFEVLGDDNLNWAKDKNNVFWGYIELDFMDSSTFEVLSKAFAKDVNYVICGEEIIEETSPKDFKLKSYVDNGHLIWYGTDNSSAYFCSDEPNGYERIVSASIESFKPLGYDFFIDDKKVMWGTFTLLDVSVHTFSVLSGGYAIDNRHVYYQNKIVKGADVSSFIVLKNDYGKDKNHRYYLHKKTD